jgi:hypothetical protein
VSLRVMTPHAGTMVAHCEVCSSACDARLPRTNLPRPLWGGSEGSGNGLGRGQAPVR